jgi:hypothetical protein
MPKKAQFTHEIEFVTELKIEYSKPNEFVWANKCHTRWVHNGRWQRRDLGQLLKVLKEVTGKCV